MTNCYVYIHRKKKDGSVFYVGRGKNRRFISKRNRNKFWQNVVEKHGFIAEIIEANLTFEESEAREIFWIKSYRDNGVVLANMTDGGGGLTGRKRPVEEIEKIRQSLTGTRWNDDRRKAWIGNKNSCGEKSQETKLKISKALKGKEKSQEHRLKLSIANTGKPCSESRRLKLIGSKRSEETKAKMRESHAKRLSLRNEQRI